ncbi:hypothetical protein ACODNH_19890 (plasmid) [Haloarcula sp. NS06]|uniref:hypothetical protein n=1 Tax=Haloarcula sp. NS06 TaxID=3409688 RepID=UPI003DA78D9A
MKEFAKKVRDLNKHHGTLDPVIEEVKDDLSHTIDIHIRDERETIINSKTEDLKQILDKIQYRKQVETEELYNVLTVFQNVISGDMDIDAAPKSLPDTILNSGHLRRIKNDGLAKILKLPLKNFSRRSGLSKPNLSWAMTKPPRYLIMPNQTSNNVGRPSGQFEERNLENNLTPASTNFQTAQKRLRQHFTN